MISRVSVFIRKRIKLKIMRKCRLIILMNQTPDNYTLKHCLAAN